VIALLLFVSSAHAQDEPATPPADDAAANTDANEDDAAPKDECEEAWEYLEFLKAEIKEPIEKILQETLFEPSAILATTVSNAMAQVLTIRDAILERTKAIRNKDESITICPEQDVNQEQFLTQARMEIMTILLSLIEQDAATPAKLQEIGKQLLSTRTTVNTEITRIIMLRETDFVSVRTPEGDCDCGILGEIVDGLDTIINPGGAGDDAEVVEAGPTDGAEDAAAPVDGAAAPAGDGAAPAAGEGDAAEGGETSPITGMTMTIMTIDARIAELYNQILTELDEEKRAKDSTELTMLKDFSLQLNDVVSKMVKEDTESEAGQKKVQKLVDRDVTKIKNEIERKLDQCRAECPGECDSCGSAMIEELKAKLQEHKSIIEDLEEAEAKDSIRNDLMTYLTKANKEMTELLKEKAESEDGNTLEDCAREKLEVLEKVKGPLWMMVNVSIFESEDVLGEMITALEQALDEMSLGYCSPGEGPEIRIPVDEQTCDLDEINAARIFITDIDLIISESLFKASEDDARKNAMIGIIELKSSMDDRVRALYNNVPICHEEVNQIKSTYADQLSTCLGEMMNPRINFATRSRAERVRCVKELRISIEERRGELLLREVEKSIQQAQAAVDGVAENEVPES